MKTILRSVMTLATLFSLTAPLALRAVDRKDLPAAQELTAAQADFDRMAAIPGSMRARLDQPAATSQNTPPSVTASATVNVPRLPPTTKAPRSYPRLINYFHIMNLPENHLPNREALLAQWDVIILDPQLVKAQGLSLARIRSVNPQIEILAWVPFGQESGASDMTSSFPGLANAYVRSVRGTPIVPPWGGHMMNPWCNDFAWAKHVAAYSEAHLLVPGMYDGILFDCLGESAPAWASSDGTADIDGNGKFDQNDNVAWRAGVTTLLQTLRADRPKAILIGNGGAPWSSRTPYFTFTNGDMAENGFGNEFGNPNASFEVQWEGYRTALAHASQPVHYFLVADLRMDRTLAQAKEASGLTADDQRRFRLALATTLLGDGYFGFDRGDCLHGQLWWFDEYDIDLGAPLGTYQTDAHGKGTLSREYTHGTAVVNPTDHAVPITFSAQRTDASTKIAATAFTLPARDGRIYLR
jgi:Hypothetical glycosyl hydrolase family 15